MVNGLHLKVCGQTRAGDARVAAEIGADYLGFIFYPKSPRAITLDDYKALAAGLPSGPRRVAVMVAPSAAELSAAVAAGFGFFQIHFEHTTPLETVHGWSAITGPSRLWLAPKLPPGADVPVEWLPLADTFLLDTFHADGFGGSGKTGDWAKFARHRAAHPEKTWILAGGLNPDNVADAVAKSGARFVDVNSGVESAPGLKDQGKLRSLRTALGGR